MVNISNYNIYYDVLYIHMKYKIYMINRDTPELRKYWVFLAKPGIQINIYS